MPIKKLNESMLHRVGHLKDIDLINVTNFNSKILRPYVNNSTNEKQER